MNAANLARMRKTLVVAVFGLLELAAFIIADPRDLPPWVVTAALAVNAIGVYLVRNAAPASAEGLLGRRAKATKPQG